MRMVYESSRLELFTTGVWLYLMKTSVVMMVRIIPRSDVNLYFFHYRIISLQEQNYRTKENNNKRTFPALVLC